MCKSGATLHLERSIGSHLSGKLPSVNTLNLIYVRHFKAYIILLAPWSRVQLRVRPLDNRPQFAIFAREDIGAGVQLHELAGTMSTDAADNVAHSELSTMFATDGTTRMLSGPIRLVNHHCSANTSVSAQVLVALLV